MVCDMNKYMTMEEIDKEFDGNFVCVAYCKTGENYGVIGGEVVAVSKNKKDVYDVWGKFPDSMCYWAGELPDEFKVMLL
jgi:hypothetical protein